MGPAERLMAACEGMGLDVDPGLAGRLVAFLDRMALEPQNLTAVDGIDDGVDRHLADALAALTHPVLAGPVADIGSGGGVPGLVLAMARPHLAMTLVESETKKAHWLATASADLPNVRVVADRTEHLARAERGAFRTVTARAVAPLPATLELAAPLVSDDGHILVWSTADDHVQAAAATDAAALLGFAPLPVLPVRPFEGARRVLRAYVRRGPTPSRYPRRAGRAASRPIVRAPEG